MEYKIGDEVIVKCLGSVWTIRFIRVVPDTGRTYFVSQDNETMWVDEYEIKPAIPRKSRWELKARIIMDCRVPLLETRCKELEEENKELKQKLVKAQEAIEIAQRSVIVENLGKHSRRLDYGK